MDLNLNGKKNILLLGNIILQLGFYIMYLVLLKENGIDKNLFFLSFLFSLSNGFSFLISIEEREKKYFYTVCISLIALHIYFILEPFLEIYIEDILLLRYFFLLQLIFSYMEIILEGQYKFTYFRGISFLYYLAIFILEIFLKQNTVFLNRINFYFLCLFPLLFFLVKRKDIEGYGLYSYKIILFSTHIISDIEAIKKNVIILNDGKIQANTRADHLVEEMAGKVFEKYIHFDDLEEYTKRVHIIRMRYEDMGLRIRYTGDKQEDSLAVGANLEDYYVFNRSKEK